MEQHLIGGITMREFIEADFPEESNDITIRTEKIRRSERRNATAKVKRRRERLVLNYEFPFYQKNPWHRVDVISYVRKYESGRQKFLLIDKEYKLTKYRYYRKKERRAKSRHYRDFMEE